MKNFIIFSILIVLFSSCNYTDKYDIPEFEQFFNLKFPIQKGSETNQEKIWVISQMDSLQHFDNYAEFGDKMFAFNLFLKSYSLVSANYNYLDSLLPDTNRIRHAVDSMIKADVELKKKFYMVINRKMIDPISIDSLMITMSRFFVVKRYDEQIGLNICGKLTDEQKIHENENSPFYNAFCFMTIYNHEKSWDIFEKVFGTYGIKPYEPNTISDLELNKMQHDLYKRMSESLELRELVLDEYSAKRQYLNFEIIF